MTSAMTMSASHDQTDLPRILRAAARLGVLQTALIALFAFLQPRLEGMAELAVCGVILLAGVAATIVLPGRWTAARTIEGIAGAAGIGLAATVVFLLVDSFVLQRVGLYTNRWLQIGGGSNWWYHPVWWMVGTYLTWLGAWAQANQAAKHGAANPVALVLGTLVLAGGSLGLAVVLGLPNAGWNLGSFGVAILPGLALFTALSAIGARRR